MNKSDKNSEYSIQHDADIRRMRQQSRQYLEALQKKCPVFKDGECKE